jgi:TPR repeat protein
MLKQLKKILFASMCFMLLVQACSADSDRQLIISADSFDELTQFLGNQDIEIVAFTLWRMQSIDDNRVPDLFISLWEKDGKYREYYNKNIEENVLIRMVVASALIQYGYYYSNQVEQYLIQKAHDSREKVRAKAAEMLSSAGSVEAVEILSRLLESDSVNVSIRAFDSLLLIANNKKRLIEPSAVLFAQGKVKQITNNLSLYNPVVQQYINKNKYKADYLIQSTRKENIRFFPSQRVYPPTARLLRPYVEKGDPYATYLMGIKYLDGDEVERDSQAGVKLLLDAATGGYSHSYYELAERYRDGNGVQKDSDKEFHYRKLLSKSLKDSEMGSNETANETGSE